VNLLFLLTLSNNAVPPFLPAEMEKESMLYGELLRKNQQLRKLQAAAVDQAGDREAHSLM
jgi:hypothetical protein